MSHSITELVTKIKNYILTKDDGVLDTIATVENTTTASQDYAIGDNLILNRVLYDVTATIETGDILSTSTNISVSNKLVDIIATKAKKPVMLTRILLPGYTQITFPIEDTGNVFVDFFTDTGIGYTDISISANDEVTLTFEPQSANVTVYCLVQEL